jgi:AraC-like DNA-binding protein
VDKNVTDRNLTLELIAAYFNMHPSYLTRFFKTQTGQPLMKYIDAVRMEKAKALLRNTPRSLDDILFACGYVDKDNFCRKFKTREKLTPLQYRKLSATAGVE